MTSTTELSAPAPARPARSSSGGSLDRPPDPTVPFRGVRPGVHSESGVLRSAVVDVSMRGTEGGEPSSRALATALKQRGVVVLGQRDLLTDLLGSTEARRVLVERIVDAEPMNPVAARRVQRILLHLEPAAATRAIIDGLPARNWDVHRAAASRERFLLPPMPRSRSLRGASIVIGRRVLPALPSSDVPAGRRAVTVAAMVQRMHPQLLTLRPVRYAPEVGLRRSAARVDGDDVLLADDGSLVVGIGHRTTAYGARQLARTVLAAGAVPRVLVVALPKDSRLDRLDRLVGLVDHGIAAVHPAALDEDVVCWTLTPSAPGSALLTSTAPRPFRLGLAEAVGTRPGGLVVLPGEPGTAGADDYLPVEPGVVLTSAPSGDPSSRALERAGVEVVPVDGAAGPAGGLRRLMQPVLRDRAVG